MTVYRATATQSDLPFVLYGAPVSTFAGKAIIRVS